MQTMPAETAAGAGTVAALYRYPIKGLSPQAEGSIAIVAGEGLPLDRHYALALGDTPFDKEAPEPLDKSFFLMLRRDEALAALKTTFDAGTNRLVIVEPGGATIEADLSTAEGRDEVERFFERYIGAACRGRPRLVEAAGHKFTDVSVMSPEMMRAVSVINHASVDDLARHCGRSLDPLRFRANIYLDGVAPWGEFDWIGRELAIGGARFKGALRTRRCAAVDVDPKTAARDTAIPRTLMQSYGHPDCGIYLEVLEGGLIQHGDRVRVLN